jgi:HSP20 family protein
MPLIRWSRTNDPYTTQAGQLRDAMDRLFDSYFTAPATPVSDRWPAWSPAIDVVETKDAYHVKAEVPGIAPGDIDISMTGNTLTLKGEKKEEKTEGDTTWHRTERTYGSFVRTLELPEGVDPERVQACHDKGVLTIEIAKSERVKPRTIKVNVT